MRASVDVDLEGSEGQSSRVGRTFARDGARLADAIDGQGDHGPLDVEDDGARAVEPFLHADERGDVEHGDRSASPGHHADERRRPPASRVTATGPSTSRTAAASRLMATGPTSIGRTTLDDADVFMVLGRP